MAGYSWVSTGQSHGVWVARIAEMWECPEQDSFSSASELPAVEFSVDAQYGAGSGQHYLHEAHDAAADTSDASLLTALLVAAAAA